MNDDNETTFDAATRCLLDGARRLEAAARDHLTSSQVARMFLRVGVYGLVPAVGPVGAAAYLRAMADHLDGLREEPTLN